MSQSSEPTSAVADAATAAVVVPSAASIAESAANDAAMFAAATSLIDDVAQSESSDDSSSDASSSSSTSSSSPVLTSSSSAASSSSTPVASTSKSRRRAWDKCDLKMVLCVRNDLQMGKGKMMAQCCHAAVGVVQHILKSSDPELVDSWDYNGAKKIALKVASEADLVALAAAAAALGLPNYLVRDAGHTQVAPDTKTVVAIGPAPAEIINKITGHLKLM